MNTTSLWDKATLNTGVVHETGAQRSLTKAVETPMTVPLAGGALSSLCLVTISFVEYGVCRCLHPVLGQPVRRCSDKMILVMRGGPTVAGT